MIDKLTDRELQVLSLYCDGLDTKSIASVLQLSPKTIKNVRHYLGLKFGVHTTVQLVLAAIKKGVVKA